MSVQELLNVKHMNNDMKKTSILMAIHCAPLIKGIKAANIITVTARELMSIRQMLVGTGISYYTLKLIPRSATSKGRSETKHILYLFRKKELIEYLSRADVKELLCEYGYEEELHNLMSFFCDDVERDSLDLENVELTILIYKLLKKLSDRIMLYCGGNIEFPHEIGAFLEYPVEDVKGFLENKGEKFLYSGYWKVYHNVDETVKLFARYDKEREITLKEVMDGKSIKDIAV